MCAEYFPGMTSRISGIGISGIQRKAEAVHARGWQGDAVVCRSAVSTRRALGRDPRMGSTSMHMLQMACNKASYQMWKQYSAKMQSNPPIHLRDLLDIKPLGDADPD